VRKVRLIYYGLILILLLSSCGSGVVQEQPKVKNGQLDLRHWDFTKDGTVRLDGSWDFFWDASVKTMVQTPKTLISVPGSWRDTNRPLRGKAVYQLEVLTKPETNLYGLKLYELPQSYRLYINDQQILENGVYNQNPELSQRSLVRPIAIFAHAGEKFVIKIEVVNLNEQQPGPRRSIILGAEAKIRQLQDNQLISDMLVVGVLLIMGLYHLGLYWQRRRDLGSLLFGLLCMVMIFRIAVTEEHYLHQYFPNFSGSLEGLLDVFSFFVLTPTFAWIFSYFFKEDSKPVVLKTITWIFVVVSVLYAFSEAQVLFNFYLGFTLATGIYLLYVLFCGVQRQRFGSKIFLIGFLLFVGTSIWDILSYSNIVRTIYVSQIGFVSFIFAQAYVLSMRFNQALIVSEKLTLDLETIVTERTAALEESNRRLAALNITDALTGIANRRHFDLQLQQEWDRALRTERPLALLILDIDHFKLYNDHYGHQGGDTCLHSVASILIATVNRAGDTVARYGGEEFVVLLPETNREEALLVGERIRQAIEAASVPHAKSSFGFVSVSLGVSSQIPALGETPQQLLKQADDALYQAKKLGRNRVVLADQFLEFIHHAL
jgi:diguanylate cyclase (GGDEF)-like protein